MKHFESDRLSLHFPLNYQVESSLTVFNIVSFKITLFLCIFFSAAFLLPTTGNAQWDSGDQHRPREIRLSEVTQGSLLIKTDQPDSYYLSPTVDTDVTFQVSGLIVRAKVVQTFTNPDDDWIEGIYVFPLPENAAVDHMQMTIGERVIVGEIKEKAQAKKIYEAAKRQGKKASLIEQERPNLFTNSVANIGPKESVTVEIEYQQTLKYEQINGEGLFQLRFPTTFTPRFIPGSPVMRLSRTEEISEVNGTGWVMNTDQVPDASRITPQFREYGDWGNPISITVTLNPGFPVNSIVSPYHKIRTTHDTNGKILVE